MRNTSTPASPARGASLHWPHARRQTGSARRPRQGIHKQSSPPASSLPRVPPACSVPPTPPLPPAPPSSPPAAAPPTDPPTPALLPDGPSRDQYDTPASTTGTGWQRRPSPPASQRHSQTNGEPPRYAAFRP